MEETHTYSAGARSTTVANTTHQGITRSSSPSSERDTKSFSMTKLLLLNLLLLMLLLLMLLLLMLLLMLLLLLLMLLLLMMLLLKLSSNVYMVRVKKLYGGQ
ncbi:hypothetical protein DIURU_003986 [Diutina rugosa]|uniref:Uncharacterized protein n=1 Tax=Diutina rugosa TaxID=5481 RepID=A0A642UQV3_DIURU|nr:uncharacterized protein DIURU_003986 [Diutina rugosa]KAA8900038.1 hypothetical protein DIURU_003986 [Diutina rugosa]